LTATLHTAIFRVIGERDEFKSSIEDAIGSGDVACPNVLGDAGDRSWRWRYA
jgi:hypothetical protein